MATQTMFPIIPVVPLIGQALGRVAVPAAQATVKNPALLAPAIGLGGLIGSAAKVAQTVSHPNFWKRAGVIAAGLWIVYLSLSLWVASNETVQGAVASVVTKNPIPLAESITK